MGACNSHAPCSCACHPHMVTTSPYPAHVCTAVDPSICSAASTFTAQHKAFVCAASTSFPALNSVQCARPWAQSPVACATMAPQRQEAATTSSTPATRHPIQLITTTFLKEALGLCDADFSTSDGQGGATASTSSGGHQVAGSVAADDNCDCSAGYLCPPTTSTYVILLNWGMPSCLPQLWERGTLWQSVHWLIALSGYRLCT